MIAGGDRQGDRQSGRLLVCSGEVLLLAHACMRLAHLLIRSCDECSQPLTSQHTHYTNNETGGMLLGSSVWHCRQQLASAGMQHACLMLPDTP